MTSTESISIAEALAGSPDKLYRGLTDSDGFEWGFGRAGRYLAHAHQVFFDVLFAPGGMDLRVGETQVEECRFFVAAPGCRYDTVNISDFWFMKFVGDAAVPRPELPEKVVDGDTTPAPGVRFFALSSGIAELSFSPWHGPHDGQVSFAVRQEADAWTMRARLTTGRSFVIRP